jgi:RNA polymerase sigma-70 factor (ECF subfamily)
MAMLTVEECVRSRYGRMLGVLRAASGGASESEDALQEACAKGLEFERRMGELLRHPEAWIVTVALNHLRSHIRRIARFPALARVASVSEDVHRDIDLERAIARLPLRQRQAVVCHYYFGLTVAEVGEVLGVSPGTVKTALSRGREALGVRGRVFEQAEGV